MSVKFTQKSVADIIDLDFYRRFRVILPLNPKTLSKRFALCFLKSTQQRKNSYATRRRSKRRPSQRKDSPSS